MDTTLALPDDENKENIGRESRRILKTSVSPKDIWWSNMMLLGFCPVENEKVYGLVFHPDMFEQASTKGMQVVLYYLLRQINRDKAKKAFKGCWPTLDIKNNLNDYKKAANQLITELEHDGEIPSGTFRLSHLQSVGTRFYTLLAHLSTAALRGAMVKKYPSVVIPPKQSIDAGTHKQVGLIGTAAKRHIALQRQRFVAHAQDVVAEQTEWRTYAQELETEYRSLTQQMNKLKEERKRFTARFDRTTFPPDHFEVMQKKVEIIKRAWDLLAQHYEENAANREMLDRIALGKASKLELDQASMHSDLTSLRQQLLSLSICSPASSTAAQVAPVASQNLSYQECQQLLSVNPIRDDKVDLLTLHKLWSLSLALVKKRIDSNHLLERPQGGSSQLAEDAPMLTNVLNAHQHRLAELSAFNNGLNEGLPTLQEQTAKLRKLMPEPTVPVPSTPSRKPLGLHTPSRASADASIALELLPPTPDLALEKCLDEAIQDDATHVPAQVGATPLPKREDQERMVDSIRRAAKQRRPRLSIGSGRSGGGSAMALKKAMFSRGKPSDEDKLLSNETGGVLSPLNTSGSSSDGEQPRWSRPEHMGGLDLSPMREMTAQFTLNLGLFSPFGGLPKGATRAGGAFPSFASRAPAPLRSQSPVASPVDTSPFASDPLSFMDPFGAPKATNPSDRKPFKPAFKADNEEDAWLMKEDSFLQPSSSPLPLQSFSTFSTDYSHKNALAPLGDEGVLAQLDELDRDDETEEELDHLSGTAVQIQDVISMMADKLTSNIMREDEGWQEEALNDLSMALDDLEDDDLGGRTEHFSTNITAPSDAPTGTQPETIDDDAQAEEDYEVDDGLVGEADFSDLEEDEPEYVDEEPQEELDNFEPEDANNLSVEIRESVREEAKKKRISLGFDLRELESDEDEDEDDVADVIEEVGETNLVKEDEGDNEADEVEEEDVPANVNWSMAIESEEEGEDEEEDDEEEDEEEDNTGIDDEEGEEEEEINMEAEIAKAGGLEDSNPVDDTALGDYSVLDITFKPPKGDGEDDVPSIKHNANEDLFADLQEELGEQGSEDDEQQSASVVQASERFSDDEDLHVALEDSFEEVRSIDELVDGLSSAEASSAGNVATATTVVVDDIFFGLDDEEREAKVWDTFCASPAVGLEASRRTDATQLGLSLLSVGEMDETVMDGLLTPVPQGGLGKKDDDLARRLTAVTPSLHPGTVPTRPRKKLSFSSVQ